MAQSPEAATKRRGSNRAALASSCCKSLASATPSETASASEEAEVGAPSASPDQPSPAAASPVSPPPPPPPPANALRASGVSNVSGFTLQRDGAGEGRRVVSELNLEHKSS
ncbi:probable septum site-determining protein MinC [Schistocerca piceifrons]|uniref:probable septum site-determining protein MinC n=1 Tax=Schistocerca piceifrons TaxID=274613 RepID=UPI001F5ECFE5|nr:probable septum site-determining protein MinC [Schistocerca piceifrons]